ncbi:iron-siderophore ABC transporter substrate-binding protein [Fulvimarina endophytica]|nr:iron-siderophore ABC transporter substrate-binding protein [Fulvimarina endophytica]
MARNAVADDAFPVTIDHAFGRTTIEREPERIVTLGWGGEDAVVALGKVPVAMTYYPYWQSGIAEWNEPRIGASKPVPLGGMIDFEMVALLKPDLILAVFSGVDELAYRRLSRIAPVVTFEKGPWLADWRAQMRLAGRALGRAELAAQLIARTEDVFRQLRRSYPILQGRSVAFMTNFPLQAGVDVYLKGDRRLSALEELGLLVPPAIRSLGKAGGGRYSVSLGMETLPDIDADVVVAWFQQGLDIALIQQPILKMLPAIREKRVVTLDTPGEIWSVLVPTAISIDRQFPHLAQRMAEVLENARK